MSLLVVGSMAFDSIKSPFGEVERVIGGSATYFSLAASYLAPVRLVSIVGRDFPKGTLDMLSARGIDLQGLKVSEGATFHWKGYYEYDLNVAHTVKTDLNVFEDFAPVLPASYRESRYVFLGNIDPKLQLDILAQVREPKIVALDTMNFWIGKSPQLLREVIRSVDIVVINEAEIRELTGEFNLVKAARKVMRMGPGRVVIKRGEYGVLHLSDGEIFAAPAYPLETIFDPTGAGDSFAGGFMGYLASRDGAGLTEMDYRLATMYGSAIASFTVEAFSTGRLQGLSREEIESRLAAFRALTEFRV
ncbi:MAG TPA: sugar kinase [Deltaproteobacteria bacterium]|nr:MAG: sugar kinase [Deltaproteobacteria bacterium GWA2_65_63]OGP28773.1 MAG: sugar kinase [Deltaproteobacteria bacterium GWB2_65_81]OGP37635.1 MAG: sugar kinase [Deltaproteobacteria bacterium GWC2_66_88]HAM32905.1 sugar kinase [Deltaproteobacteria bacterium]HBG72373.1 sugar kinase [Deltaproteobacteria bacterium]